MSKSLQANTSASDLGNVVAIPSVYSLQVYRLQPLPRYGTYIQRSFLFVPHNSNLEGR